MEPAGPGTTAPGPRPASLRVAPLDEARVAAAVETLAAAFRDNPLNRAVIGGDPRTRLRANRAGMRQLVPQMRRHALALAAGSGSLVLGVLLAVPPLRYPLPPPPLGRQLRTLVLQGPRVAGRWARVFTALDRIHPREPHWYLATLGVAPVHHGRGIGRSLLAHLIRRADEADLPVHLETDRPENVPFYQASGFRVVGEARVLDVPIWTMQRPPRSD